MEGEFEDKLKNVFLKKCGILFVSILFLFQEVMQSNVDVSDGTRSRQYIPSNKQLKVDSLFLRLVFASE